MPVLFFFFFRKCKHAFLLRHGPDSVGLNLLRLFSNWFGLNQKQKRPLFKKTQQLQIMFNHGHHHTLPTVDNKQFISQKIQLT